MTSFVEIGPLVQEKKNFKGFYHIWAWRPSGSSDLDYLLEKVPQDLFHSVYFEYEENCTHDRLLSLNYAFCHIKR